jgi:hypothetical protein
MNLAYYCHNLHTDHEKRGSTYVRTVGKFIPYLMSSHPKSIVYFTLTAVRTTHSWLVSSYNYPFHKFFITIIVWLSVPQMFCYYHRMILLTTNSRLLSPYDYPYHKFFIRIIVWLSYHKFFITIVVWLSVPQMFCCYHRMIIRTTNSRLLSPYDYPYHKFLISIIVWLSYHKFLITIVVWLSVPQMFCYYHCMIIRTTNSRLLSPYDYPFHWVPD